MWNQLIILPILLLKTTSAYPDYDDGNVVVPCGAPGGSCHLYCQTHSKDDYDYNYNPWDYNDHYYHYKVCQLKKIDYSKVKDADDSALDLSGLCMDLGYIYNGCIDDSFPKNKIKELNLAGNLFHNPDYYGPLDSLENFVSNFSNLVKLNISNTTTGLTTNDRRVEQIWENNRNLTVLDISNNRNKWQLSSNSSTFHGMVNLKHLNLRQCCESGQNYDVIEEDFLRDLVNLEYLDISANQWDFYQLDQIFFSLQELQYLNMSQMNSTSNSSSSTLPDLSVALRKQKNLQSLDLSFAQEGLDVSVFDIVSPSLSHLTIRGNLLSGFSSMKTSFGLKDPASLRILDLSQSLLDDDLGIFPHDLGGLQKLYLGGSHNFLDNFNSGMFQNNSQLTALDLSFLHIWGTSSNLFTGLKRLEFLNMEGTTLFGYVENQMDKFFHSDETEEGGETLSRNVEIFSPSLKSLERVNLGKAKCYECNIWKQLGKCSQVKHLDLGNSEGFEIDSRKYFKLPNLQSINVSHSILKTIYLTNFTQIQHLDLTRAKIDDLAIFGTNKIESIDFSFTDMGSVVLSENLDSQGSQNASFPAISHLKKLNFSHSAITFLNLTNLRNLSFIDLSHSKIDRLVLSTLPGVHKIDLSYSSVRVLKVSKLSNLQVLDLSNSDQSVNLKRLNVNRFKKLSDLNISASKLFSLPNNTFNELLCLKSLNLSDNFLSKIPKAMLADHETCPLVELDLSNNYLKVLPFHDFKPMINIYSDWTVYLGRNLLNCSDCRNSWLTTKSYHFNLQDAVCETPFEDFGKSVTDVKIC